MALLALYLILATTAAWWALALWPAPGAPEWLARTRALCFGSSPDGLPNAGGWILLIGQPLGMIAVLLAVWGGDLRAAVAGAIQRRAGQVLLAATPALLLLWAGLVAARLRTADTEPFDPGGSDAVLTRFDDPAPALALLDQRGQTVTMASFLGRPVLVTFAYAHCETVCPVLVHEVLEAQKANPDRRPAVVVVTLDPWRDTPARLPSIAEAWSLDEDARVLSGSVPEVERVLSAWRIPRVRNEASGDLSHPSIVYVVSPAGRLVYALAGGTAAISEAIRSL